MALRALPLLLAGALTAGLLACGSDAVDTAAPGRRDYLESCATCHGSDRKGIGSNTGLPVSRMQQLGAAEIRRIIVQGGTTMTGFGTKLSDAQLDAIVAYLLAP